MHRLVPLVVFVFAGATPGWSSNFTFLKPTPISAVCQTFAKIGRFNVVLCEGSERDVTFRVTDVSPEAALRLVTLSHGLAVAPMPGAGSQPTYVVGTPDQLARFEGELQTQVIRLRFTTVDEVQDVIQDMARGHGVRVKGLASRNTLILQGSREGLDRIVTLVGYLDVPVSTVSMEVRVRKGDANLFESVLETESGREVRAVFSRPSGSGAGAEGGPETPGSLRIALVPRVNEDGFLDLDSEVSLGPGGKVSVQTKVLYQQVTTRTQFPAGELHEVARIVVGQGAPLIFEVRATTRETPALANLDSEESSGITPPSDEIELDEPADGPPATPEPGADELGDLDIDLDEGGPGPGWGGVPPLEDGLDEDLDGDLDDLDGF